MISLAFAPSPKSHSSETILPSTSKDCEPSKGLRTPAFIVRFNPGLGSGEKSATGRTEVPLDP